MNKHANALRQTRASMLGTEDEQHYADCHKAADYIDRLQELADAAKNLRQVKGRHHSEQATKALFEALDNLEVNS